MKLNHIFNLTTVITFAGLLTFTSCKKDSDVTQSEDPTNYRGDFRNTR